MYRIIIKRDGTNKLTGMAVYMVVRFIYFDIFLKPVFTYKSDNHIKIIGILSKKPYRAGCYINPAKVLRESGFVF